MARPLSSRSELIYPTVRCPVVVTEIHLGKTHSYPVDLRKPILLKTTMINNGELLSGTDLFSAIDLSQYTGQDIPNCYWSVVPTYGSLYFASIANLPVCFQK